MISGDNITLRVAEALDRCAISYLLVGAFSSNRYGIPRSTKDADFVRLLETHGPPPQIVWLTCGNTSNLRLQELFMSAWPAATKLLEGSEPLVEVGGRS